MIEMISKDPSTGERLSENIDYCPAEISVMKEYEFIYDSEDLIRRRTLSGQTDSKFHLETDSEFSALIELLNK